MNLIPKGFKLNGTVVDNGLVSNNGRRIMAYLDKLPADELVTSAALASALGWQFSSFRNYMTESSLQVYRCKVANKLVWGSKKAVAKLKQSLES